MKCPLCKNHFTDPDETQVIEDWGHCLTCDKLEGQEELAGGSELEVEDLI